MSFLAPLYFLGVLAIALPLAFHLWKRHVRGEQLFSTLMFLEAAPPRATTRQKLNDWLLLLLRGMAVILLAFAFTRPLWNSAINDSSALSEQRRVVILVDCSASLQRDDLWDQAVEQVEQTVRAHIEAEELTVLLFADDVQPLVSCPEWRALPASKRLQFVGKRLEDIKPGAGGTNLVRALQAAEEELRTPVANGVQPSRCELVLISDLQSGGPIQPTAGWQWPTEWPVTVKAVQSQHPTNAGLAVVKTEDPTNYAIRVTNSADATESTFTLQAETILDKSALTSQVQVSAGGTSTVSLSKTIDGQPVVRVRLSGDDHDFDNTLTLPEADVRRQQVIYAGSDAAENSRGLRYYLARALPRERMRVVEVCGADDFFSANADKPAAFSRERTPLVVVTESLDRARLPALQQAIADGCTALVVLQTAEDIEIVSALTGVSGWSAEEHAVGEFDLLGELDFEHPLLQPFAGVEFANFTGIPIWRRRAVSIPASLPEEIRLQVPARFANGDPALLEVSRGTGRVFVLAFGWHPQDSQLARASKFPPLIRALLDSAGTDAATSSQPVTAGSRVALPKLDANGEVTATAGVLTCPAGTTQPLSATATEIIAGDQSGLYRWRRGDVAGSFVVQIPTAESQTAPLSADDLFALGLPGVHAEAETESSAVSDSQERTRQSLTVAHSQRDQQRTAREQQQAWWRWTLLAAAGVLCIETLYASRVRNGDATAGESSQETEG